jgi:hypothetical protein
MGFGEVEILASSDPTSCLLRGWYDFQKQAVLTVTNLEFEAIYEAKIHDRLVLILADIPTPCNWALNVSPLAISPRAVKRRRPRGPNPHSFDSPTQRSKERNLPIRLCRHSRPYLVVRNGKVISK